MEERKELGRDEGGRGGSGEGDIDWATEGLEGHVLGGRVEGGGVPGMCSCDVEQIAHTRRHRETNKQREEKRETG